jgi:3-oxoacyl-(acyl-carrier-protein) synthase
MGGAFAVDAADASAFAALSWAHDQLRFRACDMVVCGACQRSMDLTFCDDYVWRNNRVAHRDVALGEGAVCLVLKRLSDARRSGDRIRGILHASAFASAATLDEALSRAMRDAAALAAVEKRSIGFAATANFGPRSSENEAPESAGPDTRQTTAALDSQCRQFGDLQGANGLLMLMRWLLTPDHEQPSRLLNAASGSSNASAAANSVVSIPSTTQADMCVASLRLTTNHGMLSPGAGTAGEFLVERGDDPAD